MGAGVRIARAAAANVSDLTPLEVHRPPKTRQVALARYNVRGGPA